MKMLKQTTSISLVPICVILVHLFCFITCDENPLKEEAIKLSNIHKDIDTDRNKKLTRQEVIIYLVANKIGYKPDSDYFKDIVDGLFDEHDKNKDGLIAYDEFVPRHDEL
ncbi:Hypothetical predicted protein [Mytilus galloprovincialis]|uniref:EF-hand domain-containing protein n=2 Tax=Mytilus galloprovincialis TaxID=29158 RepID=A0A8B6CBR8_MYTGA|nr:Hypothetical predicted protein [Mytilus galloprovincialis]